MKPFHIVEAVLCGLPVAKRDTITAWMWAEVPSFDDWTPELLDRAMLALGVEG